MRPMVTLELTLTEAEAAAAESWLLKPAADGTAALENEEAKSMLVKLGTMLDYIEGVSRVREELEQAGFAGEEQVADLGGRIGESPIRRYAGNGN